MGEEILKLLLAALLGFLLGCERLVKRWKIGPRTMAIISVTACMFVVAGIEDIGHVIEGIAAGIGFIGGAVIWVERGRIVRGLTTAATIWFATSLGVLVGAGYTLLACLALFLVMVILLLKRIFPVIE